MSPHSCRLRLGREAFPRHALLITSTCTERRPLLAGAEAAKTAMQVARDLDAQQRWRLFAMTVMPDHVHLVVRTTAESLSRLMQAYKGLVAHRVNEQARRHGRFWQAGYHDVGLGREADFWNAIYYCLENPVKAGIVGDWREFPFSWCRWEL